MKQMIDLGKTPLGFAHSLGASLLLGAVLVLAICCSPSPAQPDPGDGSESGANGQRAPDAELVLTARQQSDISKLERRILAAEDKVKQYGPDSSLGKSQLKAIERWKARIETIHTEARRKIRIKPEGAISAKADGEAKDAAAPAVQRPWKLGDWPWRFDPRDQFERLKNKYYALQTELGALLVVRQKAWTAEQAIKYQGKLSALCKLIVETEEQIAFGLGDPVKFARAIKENQREWNKYCAKQKITDDAESAMNAKEAEYYALLKKSGLEPGDTVPTDDPNARAINQAVIDHKALLVRFEAANIESEKARFASGSINEAREERIKDGMAFTAVEGQGPKLMIHRRCKNEPSLIYAMFLSDEQYDVFGDQSRLRQETQKN